MPDLHERARQPAESEPAVSKPAGPSAITAVPPGVSRVLALQRTAGNRAVRSALLQRQPPKAPEKPAKDDSEVRMGWEWDPDAWAKKVGALFQPMKYGGIIVTLGYNTGYAFDAEGGSLREIRARAPDNLRVSSLWRLDLAHGEWADPLGVIMGDMGPMPLSQDSIKVLCKEMGYEYGGPGRFWVMLNVEPNVKFTRPKSAAEQPKAKATGDTPAMRQKASKVVGDLAATWRDRPQPATSALVGTPTFKERYSERTGWHVRITLDQEVTEVSLNPGDTDKAVRDRVDAAVERMRAKYDRAKVQRPKWPQGVKSDPNAPAPPEWYVPFEGHAAVQSGKAIANAPPLPAVVLFKQNESNTHPTVMAGASYDFKMQVQWQFAGQLEGLSGVMNAGYYWEVLEATPADWYRLSGETPPEGTPGVTPTPPPAAAGSGAPAAPPSAPRTEDKTMGSGERVTQRDDAMTAGRAEDRHVGEDMANDYKEGDYTGFAGEAVAGGFRRIKTRVVSVVADIIDRRDPSSRRVTLPEPGYYLVRCVSASTRADEDSEFVRSPSVAVIPVKAQLNWGVAKASAREDLAKAGDKGTFARYTAELSSTRSTLDAAKKLQARFDADPGLHGRLSSDPVAAASDLSVAELAVLTLVDQNRTSVDQLVKDLTGQVKESAGDGQEATAATWHGELQAGTDYPVGASFVGEDTGQEIQLRLMVGQAKDSSDAAPHWIVFDITSAKTRDRYEGRAMVGAVSLSADMGGHGAALREALRKFAGENPYGYGEIGLAWPASFGTLKLKGADLPRHLRSAPDAVTRKKNRRRTYVDIATFLIPAAKLAKLKGLVKAAETFVALAGAKNAIDALRDRARTHHLDEPGTLLEIVQVIGAVKTLGAGGKLVLEANDLVHAVRRVGSSLELLTKLESGLQIIAIPFVVRQQLQAIDAMTGSTEHKVATLAFVLGRAIRDGVVNVRSIHPGEQTQFYDDSKDPRTTGGPPDPTPGGGAAGGAPKPDTSPPTPDAPGGSGQGGSAPPPSPPPPPPRPPASPPERIPVSDKKPSKSDTKKPGSSDPESGKGGDRERTVSPDDPTGGKGKPKRPPPTHEETTTPVHAPPTHPAADPARLQRFRVRMDNFRRRITASDVAGAPAAPGSGTAGHARSSHGVTNAMVAELVNAPDRIFSGMNNSRPPREVDIYLRGQDVVITVAGDKTSVITAYGATAPKRPSPVTAADVNRKWANNPNYVEVSVTGPNQVLYPNRERYEADDWPP